MPDVYVRPRRTEDGRRKTDEEVKEEAVRIEPVEVGSEKREARDEKVTTGVVVDKKRSHDVERQVKELAAFCKVPPGTRFETQEAEEEIILLLRAHGIVNVSWILLAVVMIAVPFVVRALTGLAFLPDKFMTIAFGFWYLITVAFVFEQFLNWYFNVYIVTDERIIDIDFVNLLYKRVSETKLDRIQDTTISMGGVVRSLFNFGNVYVQTAAEAREFEFGNVPRPDRVQAVIRALVTQEEQEVLEGRGR